MQRCENATCSPLTRTETLNFFFLISLIVYVCYTVWFLSRVGNICEDSRVTPPPDVLLLLKHPQHLKHLRLLMSHRAARTQTDDPIAPSTPSSASHPPRDREPTSAHAAPTALDRGIQGGSGATKAMRHHRHHHRRLPPPPPPAPPHRRPHLLRPQKGRRTSGSGQRAASDTRESGWWQAQTADAASMAPRWARTPQGAAE